MYPILFQWGPVIIPSWHFMYAIGAVCAFFLLRHLNQKLEEPLDGRVLSNLYLVCYIAGYFGARALSILVEEPDHHSFSGFFSALFSLGAMTFYGGALGAGFAGWLFLKLKKVNVSDGFDIGIPSALLALALGRVGCFLNGDDFGSVVTTDPASAPWWSVVFPNLPDQLPRYPVQLWESAAVALLLIALVKGFDAIRRSLTKGMIGYIAIAAYAQMRFLLEFFRGDFRGHPFDNWMSTSQLVSILVLFGCVLILPLKLKNRNPG